MNNKYTINDDNCQPVSYKEIVKQVDLIAAWNDPAVIEQFFLNNSLEFIRGNNGR